MTTPLLDEFMAALPFVPDPFQREAIGHLGDGVSVVVSAPTGAGKTLVAEAAIELARSRGERAFYTTPIKALSNQKFGDLRTIYGDDAVGLLTGDNVVNGDAGIVVMTTEVLRNMIYAGSQALDGLGLVVLDEVHYLQDRYRGSVWEEVIIHLPRPVQLVSLSATIANPEEFAGWVESRRGSTHAVVETRRPVPLESLYLLKDKHREGRLELFPILNRRGDRPNPEVVKLLKKGRGRYRRFLAPRRLEVAEELQLLDRLPAIYFIFSRAACDDAARTVASANLGLTTAAEREEIREVVADRTAHLSDADLGVLGFAGWMAGLEAGVAAHHAGMVPAFKETVEALFAAGLVRIVFATETLALGINMPARTVVLERMSKFTGESHEILEPGDYTQLSGRAGRRGIDNSGTAVVLHQRDIPFPRVAAIAGQGSHPLRSSFAPSYNMAVNLVANYDRLRAEEMLNASFAQYRADQRKVALQRQMEELEAEAEALRQAAQCNRGDIASFAATTTPQDVRQLMRDFAQGMIAGDVLRLDPDEEERWALLVRGYGPNPRLLLSSTAADVRRIGADDLPPATSVVGHLALPEPVRARDRSYRCSVAKQLSALELDPLQAQSVESDSADPVASCPHLSEHLGLLARAGKAERSAARLRRRAERPDDDLVATFRRLLSLLEQRGYVAGWSLTPRGAMLRQIYNELDLLVTESAVSGAMDGLAAAELAGVATVFVYEPRRDDLGGEIPTPGCAQAVDSIFELADRLALAEDQKGLAMTRPPYDGYVQRLHDWANGASLDDLFEHEAAAGDFVRIARQTLDLLRQIRDAFPSLRAAATEALDRVDRGVVAAERRW